jgi:hypothetical protein
MGGCVEFDVLDPRTVCVLGVLGTSRCLIPLSSGRFDQERPFRSRTGRHELPQENLMGFGETQGPSTLLAVSTKETMGELNRKFAAIGNISNPITNHTLSDNCAVNRVIANESVQELCVHIVELRVELQP